MKYADELRIMAERGTFTQADLQADLDCSDAWTSRFFADLVRANFIERVRVGHNWLYALTEKGKRAVNRLPVLDENERTLLLVSVMVTERYIYHNGTLVIDTSEDYAPIIAEPCRECGEMYVNLPVSGQCNECFRKARS